MKWLRSNSTTRQGLRIIILGLVGFFIIAGSYTATLALNKMSERELSQVNGREGLALDFKVGGSTDYAFYADPSGAANVSGNAGYGKLRLGGGSAQPISFGDGSGNPADLTGMTVDVDGGGSGNVVISLPQGDLTVDVPWASIVDSTTAAGNGSSFGQLQVDNVDVGNTTLMVGSNNEGFEIDFDFSLNAQNVSYTDPDGSSQDGSPGSLTLQNVDLGDFDDVGSVSLSGMTLDVDGNDGIVLGFPSSSYFEAEVGDVLAGGSSLGRFRVDDMNWNGSSMEIRSQAGGGVDGTFNLQYTADAVKLEDMDGWNGSGSTGSLLELANLKIGSTPWSGLGSESIDYKFDVDANRGLVLRTDDVDQTFDIRVGDLKVGGGSLGLVDVSDLNIGHNQIEIQPTNTGIEIDGNFKMSVDYEVRYKDQDGNSGNSAGHLSLGRSTNGVVVHDDAATSLGSGPFDYDNLTLNADPTNGLVVEFPTDEFTIEVSDVWVGSPGGPWNSFGSGLIKEIGLDNTRLEFNGKGDGVNLDGAAYFVADEVRYRDQSGVASSGFTGNSATLQLCDDSLECISFDDGSGNSVPFSNLQFDADSTEGLVVQAPSLSSYELNIGSVNISPEDGPSVPVEPIIVRNLDPAGSWLKVNPH